MLTATTDLDNHTDGTLVVLHVADKSAQEIVDFCETHGIANPLEMGKHHVTLCYSLLPAPDYPEQPNLRFTNKSSHEWDLFGDEKNCLVLKLNSPKINRLQKEALDEGLTHTFPRFKAHVTFSYDVGPDFDLSALPDYTMPISFHGLYVKAIKKRLVRSVKSKIE